ncbi:MAG: hypothetical protein FK733_07945 [Asgard group archaeon]|nr:hypothetical protein [Asgard group archaeon]
MKIAFPVQLGSGLEGELADNFYQAPKIVIYNNVEKNFQLLEKTNILARNRKSSIKLLLKNQVNVLICKGLSKRAIKRLNKYGIEIFFTNHQKVKEALKTYFLGSLLLVSKKNAFVESHKH